MLDLRKLRMLSALERLGTIAAVAEELHLTAPGVSMQLSALERQLGVGLTERQGRRLALTPAGHVLAAHGHDILDRLALAEIEVEAIRGGRVGKYRVAAFPSAARTLVSDAWRAIGADQAGIELTVTTPEPEAALAQLVLGDVDLALVHGYSNVPRDLPDGLLAEPVATEPIWVAMRSDDPLARDEVDLTELAHHPWITPERHLTCFQMTDRACGLAGFRPIVAAETMDFAVQLELVRIGAGVALVPQLAAVPLPPDVVLARPTQGIERHIVAARRATMHADAALDTLVREFRRAADARLVVNASEDLRSRSRQA
jgi:DNA-binding transcriptional LysR family regulator